MQSFRQFINEEQREGRCFELAYQAATGDYRGWTLVHGIARLTEGHQKGQKFGHAWLEKDNICYDVVKELTIEKETYYNVGQIDYTVKYSFQEAMKMALKYEHYGPWDQKIWDVSE